MGRNTSEREFDDEVYEDGYYEENFDEEEINEESELFFSDDAEKKTKTEDDKWSEDDDIESTKKIFLSFACEECDYRWDDVIIQQLGNLEDEAADEVDAVCPMCGSMNVTQI